VKPEELIDLMHRQRGGRHEEAFAWMAKMDPDFTEAFNKMVVQVFGLYGDGSPDTSTLPPKTKELVAIGILAAQRDFERMTHHLGRLLDRYGATDREVLEVFQLAGVMAGGPAMRGALAVLLEAKKKRGQPV